MFFIFIFIIDRSGSQFSNWFIINILSNIYIYGNFLNIISYSQLCNSWSIICCLTSSVKNFMTGTCSPISKSPLGMMDERDNRGSETFDCHGKKYMESWVLDENVVFGSASICTHSFLKSWQSVLLVEDTWYMSAQRKPLTCGKSLTNFITYLVIAIFIINVGE